MAEFPVQFTFTLNDQVTSAVNSVKGALGGLEAQTDSTSAATARLDATTQQSSKSSTDQILAINSLAMAGANLYMSFERVENSQVALDRANLNVQKSTNSLTSAQNSYNDAVEKYGSDSKEAKDASARLATAYDSLTVAQERADMAQRNFNNTVLTSTLTVIPSLIAMGTQAYKMYENWAAKATAARDAQAALNETTMATSSGASTLTSGLGALGGAIAAVTAGILAETAALDQLRSKGAQVNQTESDLRTILAGLLPVSGIFDFLTNSLMGVVNGGKQSTEAINYLAEAFTKADLSVQETVNDLAKLGFSKETINEVVAVMTGAVSVTEDLSVAVQTLTGIYYTHADAVKNAMSLHMQTVNETISAYNQLIDATNSYYDELVSANADGLRRIQGLKNDDLDHLEMYMLLQKQTVDKNFAAGLIDEAEHQNELGIIDKRYNDERLKMQNDYRLQELEEKQKETFDNKTEANRQEVLNYITTSEASALGVSNVGSGPFYVTSTPTININGLSSNANLQEIIEAIRVAVENGSANSLVTALNQANGEIYRRTAP